MTGVRILVKSVESDWSLEIFVVWEQKRGQERHDAIQDAVMDALHNLPRQERPTEPFTWSEIIEVPDWYTLL